MKHKLKKILCLSIFSMLFVMNSCQKEENDDFELQNIKVYHKSFNEIIKESSFKANYDKLNKVKKEIAKNTSRTVMEQQYNFTIVEREANVIVNDSMTSYTLLIERETKLDNEFENLVIVVPNNSVFQPTAYIFKVTSNTPFVENPYNTSTFIGERIVTPITLDLTQIVNSLNMPPDMCHTYQEWICTGNLHHTTSVGCTSGYSRTWTVCGSGGSGGSGGGNGSASGNTGSSDETQQEIYEGPVVHIATVTPDEYIAQMPCDKIKKQMLENPTMSTELSNLAIKASETVEHGRYKLSNASVIQTPSTDSSGKIVFNNTLNGQYTMLAHTHNSPANTTYSIFSWYDLEAIAKLMKNGKVSSECVFYLSTADGTNYAMTIDNQAQFLQFFALSGDSGFDVNIAQKRVNSMRIYYDLANETGKALLQENSTDNITDEKAFLDLLADNNMGVSLLEANDTFTSFTKVTHNKTTGNIIPQPCN